MDDKDSIRTRLASRTHITYFTGIEDIFTSLSPEDRRGILSAEETSSVMQLKKNEKLNWSLEPLKIFAVFLPHSNQKSYNENEDGKKNYALYGVFLLANQLIFMEEIAWQVKLKVVVVSSYSVLFEA